MTAAAEIEAAFAVWPTYAGRLCSTHIGAVVEIGGQRGILKAIRHTDEHPTVWVLLRGVDRQQRPLTLAPDAVVSRVSSLHPPVRPVP